MGVDSLIGVSGAARKRGLIGRSTKSHRRSKQTSGRFQKTVANRPVPRDSWP